jgi:HAD superfamily hydrolase (TIGR01509 family)
LKALILDFDGLILDTETPLFVSWQEACERHGVPMEASWWANILTAQADPPEAYALLERSSAIPVDRDQLRRVRSARELQLIEQQVLMPGVPQLLAQARVLSLSVGIASNSDRAWVTSHLSRLGILDEFRALKCRDEVARPKPHPDLYLALLDELEATPGEAISFEDSPVGVQAARAAGVFCIAVPNAVTTRLGFPSANVIAPTLAGLSLKNLIEAASGDKAAA